MKQETSTRSCLHACIVFVIGRSCLVLLTIHAIRFWALSISSKSVLSRPGAPFCCNNVAYTEPLSIALNNTTFITFHGWTNMMEKTIFPIFDNFYRTLSWKLHGAATIDNFNFTVWFGQAISSPTVTYLYRYR